MFLHSMIDFNLSDSGNGCSRSGLQPEWRFGKY